MKTEAILAAVVVIAVVIVAGVYFLENDNKDETCDVSLCILDEYGPFDLIDTDGNEIELPAKIKKGTVLEFTLSITGDVNEEIAYVQDGKATHLGNLTDRETVYTVTIDTATAFGYATQRTVENVENSTEYLYDAAPIKYDEDIHKQTFLPVSQLIDSEGKIWVVKPYAKAVAHEGYYINSQQAHPPRTSINLVFDEYISMLSYFHPTTAEIPDGCVEVELNGDYIAYGQFVSGTQYAVPGVDFGVIPLPEESPVTVYYQIGNGERTAAVYDNENFCYIIPGNSDTDVKTVITYE